MLSKAFLFVSILDLHSRLDLGDKIELLSRPKGLPKTGGRTKGTPNKTSEVLLRKLEKLGCDPIEGLATIALAPETKPDLKVRCFAELAQYVYPKRKAVDLAGQGGQSPITFTIERIGCSS